MVGQLKTRVGTGWKPAGGGGGSSGPHTHDAADITAGTLAVVRLGSSGTPSSSTFLRGDNSWATPSGGGGSTILPFISARNDSGIVPHPTTDQTSVMQNMIDVVSTAGGGTIALERGIYRANLILKPGVVLWHPRGGTGYHDGGGNSRTGAIIQGVSTAANTWVIQTSTGGYGTQLVMGIDGIDVHGADTNSTNNNGGIWFRAGSARSFVKNFTVAWCANQGILNDTDATSNTFSDGYVHLCVMNRTRSAYIGAIEDRGQDSMWSNIETSTSSNSSAPTGLGSGFAVGAYINGGNAQTWTDVISQISQQGFVVSGLANRLTACRADLSWGHDWIVMGNRNMLINALALNGGRAAHNTYNAYHLPNASPSVLGNHIQGMAIQTGANGGSHRYKHAVEDLTSYGTVAWRNTFDVPVGFDTWQTLHIKTQY